MSRKVTVELAAALSRHAKVEKCRWSEATTLGVGLGTFLKVAPNSVPDLEKIIQLIENQQVMRFVKSLSPGFPAGGLFGFPAGFFLRLLVAGKPGLLRRRAFGAPFGLAVSQAPRQSPESGESVQAGGQE